MPQIGDRIDVEFTVGGEPLLRRQGVVLAVDRSFVDVQAPFTGSEEPLRLRVAELASIGSRHWRARQEFSRLSG